MYLTHFQSFLHKLNIFLTHKLTVNTERREEHFENSRGPFARPAPVPHRPGHARPLPALQPQQGPAQADHLGRDGDFPRDQIQCEARQQAGKSVESSRVCFPVQAR